MIIRTTPVLYSTGKNWAPPSLILAAALLAAPPAGRGQVSFVSYWNHNTIGKFDLATGADLGVFANPGLNGPTGLAFDSAGNLYVANQGVDNIMKLTPGGGVSVFASTGLNGPVGLAFDSAGNLYAANHFIGTIERFTPDGVGSLFASTGLNGPVGLAFDSAGNLYAANYWGNTIERFTPDGVGSVFAGSGLGSPMGLAFDAAGNLYAANLSGWIEEFAPDGTGSLLANTGSNQPEFIAMQIPEPSALALLSIGLSVLLALRPQRNGIGRGFKAGGLTELSQLTPGSKNFRPLGFTDS